MDENVSGTTAFVLAGGGSFGAVQVGMLRELRLRRARRSRGRLFRRRHQRRAFRQRTRSSRHRTSRADLARGATRVLVLPGGFACALSAPPRGAMHALNLMIARQMVSDIERIGNTAQIAVVPPLCPIDVSPYDFTRAGELIDRAARSTREWLDDGGLARRGVPHQLRIHTHDRVAA